VSIPGRSSWCQSEGMLKIAFSDLGSRDDLLARLTDIVEEAELKLAVGAAVAEQYGHLIRDIVCHGKIGTTVVIEVSYLYGHRVTACRIAGRWPEVGR